MGFFEDAQTKLDEAKKWLDDKEGDIEGLKEQASQRADEVLAAAEQMGGSIPGDIDNTLINKAKEIKQKLAGK